MNVRSLGSVFTAAALAAVLFGCSGGGGAPSVSAPPLPLGQALPLGQVGADGGSGWGRPDTAAIAARSEPRAGSVTQSSNTTSDSNTTADEVQVEFAAGTYTIRNTRPDATWEVGTANATALPDDIAADADTVGLVAQENGGRRFVVAQTRSPSSAENTDWLTAGIWAFVPTDDIETGREFGAFADGGDLFKRDSLQALTGRARYGGRAFGVYYSISPDNNTSDAGPFGGTVGLVADFRDAGELGTISGSVTEIVTPEGPVVGVELALVRASIGSGDGGFFTGDTRMTRGGRTYEGRWGGQFFDNGAAGEAPGSVAGTFGAGIQQGNQAGALVGAFVAER